MANFNSPRYYRFYTQLQATNYTTFNNTAGVWTATGAKLVRVDENSFTGTRRAPYSRFPVLTGTRSEVAGIRGRKSATFQIRGLPIIPAGAAGVVPDTDHLWQNIFGAASTIVAATSATYAFVDNISLTPLSFFYFNHADTSFTEDAYWGVGISRVKINFNNEFVDMDVDGFAGYKLDSTGFSVFDTQGKAGLTAFPIEPGSPAIAGQPIAGFGNGYTMTINSDSLELKTRVLSVTIETGLKPVANVYGSPYNVGMIGGARRVLIQLAAIDDNSAALNDLKVQSDTDNVQINASIVAGTVAGSIMTVNLNNIQPDAFTMHDQQDEVMTELPESSAHATAPGQTNDATVVFT